MFLKKIDFLSELGLEKGEEELDSWDSEVKTNFGVLCRIRCLPYRLSQIDFSLRPTQKTPVCYRKKNKVFILRIEKIRLLLKKREKKVGLFITSLKQ